MENYDKLIQKSMLKYKTNDKIFLTIMKDKLCIECASIIMFSNRSNIDRICKKCVFIDDRDKKINEILNEK